MRTAARSSVALVLALAFTACRSAPVLQPEFTPMGSGKTSAQVAEAIKSAGAGLDWRIDDAGPGHMTGTLTVRGHQAVVDIPYSKDSVKILYKSSQGLHYSDGKIHRSYNKWVKNLSEAIQRQLRNS